MNDAEKRPRVWIWVVVILGPIVLYWVSVGPFFHWEQSALTQKQYLARKALERRVYAPLIWLEKRDPTGTVFSLNFMSIQPWVNSQFDWTKLPAQ